MSATDSVIQSTAAEGLSLETLPDIREFYEEATAGEVPLITSR